MFGFMRYAFAEKELVKLDPNLKILLIWGAQDPVTGFGKGTRHFVNKLSAMHYKVQTHEYIGMRHEILNELEHQQVYEDVANFIQASLATLD